MKDKIIKILINAAVGALTSIATVYLGASTTEAVLTSAAATGALGSRVADVVMNTVV